MPFRIRTAVRMGVAVSLLAGVAACNTPDLRKWTADVDWPELKADRASLQGKGYSDVYINGHLDGCAAGYRSAGNRDFSFAKEAPQIGDADYMQGWNTGFALCKGKYEDYGTQATPPASKE